MSSLVNTKKEIGFDELFLYIDIYLVLFTYFSKCTFVNNDYKYNIYTYIYMLPHSKCLKLHVDKDN